MKFQGHNYCPSEVIALKPRAQLKFFRSNPYKIEVMSTSLTEMLQSPKLTSTIRFESRDKILLVTIVRNYDVMTIVLKYLYFKKP